MAVRPGLGNGAGPDLRMTVNEILVGGGEIPGHVLGGNVVVPGRGWGPRGSRAGRPRAAHAATKRMGTQERSLMEFSYRPLCGKTLSRARRMWPSQRYANRLLPIVVSHHFAVGRGHRLGRSDQPTVAAL